jgi:methionyl-tRNA formyltransferase
VRPSRMFPRRPEDSRIVWAAPTRTVLALIRASSTPFPGAFTDLEGTERIHILRARRYRPDYDFYAVPGQVCLRLGGNPVVATGDGMIEIEDCRASGLDPAEAKALIGRSLRNRLI